MNRAVFAAAKHELLGGHVDAANTAITGLVLHAEFVFLLRRQVEVSFLGFYFALPSQGKVVISVGVPATHEIAHMLVWKQVMQMIQIFVGGHRQVTPSFLQSVTPGQGNDQASVVEMGHVAMFAQANNNALHGFPNNFIDSGDQL